jgi:hypothetical protein
MDGFVKIPFAALRFTFVAAAYLLSTPHSSGLRALHLKLFTLPSQFRLFARSSLIGLSNKHNSRFAIILKKFRFVSS